MTPKVAVWVPDEYTNVIVPYLQEQGLRPIPTKGGPFAGYQAAWAKSPNSAFVLVFDTFHRASNAYVVRYLAQDPNTPEDRVNDPRYPSSWTNSSGTYRWGEFLTPDDRVSHVLKGQVRVLLHGNETVPTSGFATDQERDDYIRNREDEYARHNRGLRSATIRLAYVNPALRPHLLQRLKG